MKSDSDLVDSVLQSTSTVDFAEIVRRYERLVWTIAWSVLGDYHATQDVVQETFLIAHKSLASLRNVEALDSWLSQIARREALRVAKQRKRGGQPIEFDPVSMTQSQLVSGEHGNLIDAVASLPEHERSAVVLRYFDGNNIQQVADILQRPVGTVTKQLSRAINRLHQKLNSTSKADQPKCDSTS